MGPGLVNFATDAADNRPAHDVLVYGKNIEVNTGEVTYGILKIDSGALRASTLRLVAEGEATQELIAVDDEAKLLSDSAATSIAVLANDTIPAGATVTIVSVSPAKDNGSASMSADKKTILYKPATGMIGAETLTYVVRDQAGNQSSAEVTINVASRFQNQTIAQDRDNNGIVVPRDALYGINALNSRGPKKLEASDLMQDGAAIYFDVSGDGYHTAIDELLCINLLNQTAGTGEGEAVTPVASQADSHLTTPAIASADSLFATYPSFESPAEPTTGAKRRR